MGKEYKSQTLYKKSSQGKIEQWSIEVLTFPNHTKRGQYSVSWFVKQIYGEVGGKRQKKVYFVHEGKNIGKENETTSYTQALKEAKAKFNQKLKQGYVKSLKDAQAGITDKIIEGGILPMLSGKYSKSMKLSFPVFVQPKLDGERCIAIKKNGKFTLWSRSRKQIHSCPHIIEQLNSMNLVGKIFLDGELYKHGLDEVELEKLMGSVRKKTPSKESAQVEFHIYDCGWLNTKLEYDLTHRIQTIQSLPDYFEHIHVVETVRRFSHHEINFEHDYYVKEGYEGVIVRNPYSLYQQNKRSNDSLKFKKFKESDFKIVGVVPGKDKTVIFKCETKTGFVFGATMKGDKDSNQKYLKKKSLWHGKLLNVKYQRLTGANKVPLFPVGIKIRNDL